MSGYLPPHSTQGQCSEIFQPPYSLKPSDISGKDGDSEVYWLSLPDDVIPTTKTLVSFGPSPKEELLSFQPLGFGLWGWGDVLSYGWGPSGGYDKKLDDDSVKGAWQHIWARGDRVLLDVAEHYGYTDGFAESKLGDLWSESDSSGPQACVIGDQALTGSLQRTRLGNIDIYQLHGPSNYGFWPRWDVICDGLVRAYETGNVQAIGVCNLNFEQVKYVWSYLKKRNIPLVSSQVEFSLVRQDAWRSGLIENCHKLGVAVIAYSPLAVGRLSGKYSDAHPPRGNRNFGHVKWSKIQPIVDELYRIGQSEGKTPSAVALNWVLCKGAIPIPTAKNKEQVEDCYQTLGWRLSKPDEHRLDALGLTNAWDWNLLKHFQNWWWQQG
ncbi:NADP-dependent oxidoreductase domain-containing protein [Macrophomina phaseolina]|uniref:NADP-dependent oxidoreductase domain-containing protein n=1 Tax=Macrophomina phaseolina TaxID=35725 RepID=A0ABQ8GA54_9PEZI|nr:NADP-dependent oxidoreductase domain-containing protein [Macrophomina phaseolina]